MPSIVIARYNEDLSWVEKIPNEYDIFIYNKGSDIQNIPRKDSLTVYEIPNLGRESDAYLRHILLNMCQSRLDYTVFSQGNPFEHAPNFLDFLGKGQLSNEHAWGCSSKWNDIYPPAHILESYKRKTGLLNRNEIFSLFTWGPIFSNDVGANLTAENYFKAYNVPNGTNIAAHFFQEMGDNIKAERAHKSVIGEFSYGAIFGVPNHVILDQDKRIFFNMLKSCHQSELQGTGSIGYILERLWLHIFNLPFPDNNLLSHNPSVPL